MALVDRDRLETLMEAGRINSEALSKARELVESHSETNLLAICESVEEHILRSGAFPAFPCNIGLNEVAAHFSPLRREDGDLPDDGVLKVDVGVRIGGLLVDSAISLALSDRFRGMVLAARRVLDAAIEAMYPGEKTGQIGEVIERAAQMRDYRPISNLSGHMIGEYDLHAGKSIPNVKRRMTPSLEVGEIYAVEPFITLKEGDGRVKDTLNGNIFRVSRFKRPKEKGLRDLYDTIVQRCRGLPFSPRWFVDGEQGLSEVLDGIKELRRIGIVDSYPVLVERRGAPVAQYEHTVIVEEAGARVLTA
jgi:methionyl aminopeptidase